VSNRQERKRQEREQLREARKRQEDSHARSQRTRLFLGYGVAGVLVAAVVIGLVIVLINSAGGGSGDARVASQSGSTNDVALDERDGPEPPAWEERDLEAAAEAAGCVVREDLPNEGATHIPPDSDSPEYRTSPATSGDHVEPPLQQADGAYAETPRDIYVVHSLEHGRIALQYSPDLPEENQLALRGLYDTMHAGALVFPNEDMPYAVAVSAWQNLLGCEEYQGAATMDAIRAFGIAHFGKGPEPANAFGPLDGPSPVRPEVSS